MFLESHAKSRCCGCSFKLTSYFDNRAEWLNVQPTMPNRWRINLFLYEELLGVAIMSAFGLNEQWMDVEPKLSIICMNSELMWNPSSLLFVWTVNWCGTQALYYLYEQWIDVEPKLSIICMNSELMWNPSSLLFVWTVNWCNSLIICMNSELMRNPSSLLFVWTVNWCGTQALYYLYEQWIDAEPKLSIICMNSELMRNPSSLLFVWTVNWCGTQALYYLYEQWIDVELKLSIVSIFG